MSDEYVMVPAKVVRFLTGECELEGMAFGEHPTRRPFWWRKYLNGLEAAPAQPAPDFAALPPLNADLVEILGRPNFACAMLADVLRASGEVIPRKSEAEQAHVIYWLLGLYRTHGADWADAAGEALAQFRQGGA